MDRTTLRLTQATSLARSAWGGVLLRDGGKLLASFGQRPDRTAVVVARVLGGRQVAQGAITALAPGPALLASGMAADALHAATAVGLALVSRRWRAVAVTEAVIATTLAGTGYWLTARAHRRRA